VVFGVADLSPAERRKHGESARTHAPLEGQAQVGEAQGISLDTVNTHVRSIYAKLGAGTRRDAITAARDLGLL
jgi:hypothetical protein